MGTVVDPYPDFQDGTTADPDQVDARFNTLYTLVNGNLDSDNIAADAMTADEIADDAVDRTKMKHGTTLSSTGYLSGTSSVTGGGNTTIVAKNTGSKAAIGHSVFSFSLEIDADEEVSNSLDGTLRFGTDAAGYKTIGIYVDQTVGSDTIAFTWHLYEWSMDT